MMNNPHNKLIRGAGLNQDQFDFRRFWLIVLDYRGPVLLCIATVLFLGVGYIFLATPLYEADAMLQIEEQKKSFSAIAEMPEMLSESSSSQAEIQLLRSRKVLGDAVRQLNLDISVAPNTPFPESLFSSDVMQGYGEISFSSDGEEPHGSIVVKSLSVPEEWEGKQLKLVAGKEGVFQLFMGEQELLIGEAGKAEKAGGVAVFVSKLDVPEGQTFTLVKEPLIRVIERINERLEVAEKGSDTGILRLSYSDPSPAMAERILNAIAEAYRNQNLERRSAEAEKSLSFIEQKLPEIRAELESAEDKLNEYRSEQKSVDLSFETEAKLKRLVTLEAKLNELDIKENELHQLYKPEHPAYRTLLEQRQSLKEEKRKLEERVRELPETQQQILRLRRDMEVNQEIYMQLRNRSQELRVLKAGTVSNVRIVDPALSYPDPVAPNKVQVLLLSMIFGLIAACVYLFVKILMRHGVESPEELEAMGLNVYATLPVSKSQYEGKADKDGGSRDVLLARDFPADVTVEAFRSLRTSLHFATMEASAKVLMFTGPSPGVGKSFVSVNTGYVLAQAKQNVLVIDADMRNGRVHRYFSGARGPGLSEYLAGDEGLRGVIRSGGIEGLDYISSGKSAPNAAELVMHRNFRSLLEDVSSKYDMVIIDTPPVLAVTDPGVIGQYSSATLLVVRYGNNSLKEIEVACGRLKSAGVVVKGVVLNGIEKNRSTTFGYYPYEYPRT